MRYATGGRILALVHLPPPAHGMAVVSAGVLDWLRQRFDVIAVNLAYGGLSPSRANLARYAMTIMASFQAVLLPSRPRPRTLYIALSAGVRSLIEVVLIACAKAVGLRVVVHHHSRAYIIHKMPTMGVICRLLGPRDISIFLGAAHRDPFNARYRHRSQSIVISNAGPVPLTLQMARPAPQANLVLGYLSNIGLTKGIDVFIEALRHLRADGRPVTGLVAGPYRDAPSQALVEAAAGEGLLTYLGPLDPAQKAAFYRAVDLFLFPSRYAHETEPLVVLEAMAAAVPVIATAVGCLPEILGPEYLIAEDDDRMSRTLALRVDDVARRYPQASSDMTLKFEQARARGLEGLDELARALAGS